MDHPKRARSWKRRTQPRVGLKTVEPVLYSTRQRFPANSPGAKAQRRHCFSRPARRYHLTLTLPPGQAEKLPDEIRLERQRADFYSERAESVLDRVRQAGRRR